MYSQAKFDIMYKTSVTYFGKVSVYLKEVLLSALTRDIKTDLWRKNWLFCSLIHEQVKRTSFIKFRSRHFGENQRNYNLYEKVI